MASVGVVSILIAIMVTGLFFGYQLLKKPIGKDKSEIIFDVVPGTTIGQIAKDLQKQRLIRNARVFRWYARLRLRTQSIKAGEYSLNQTMTPDDIVAVLVSGKSIARNLTIAEGLNVWDIADIFEKMKICTREEFFKIVYDKAFIKSLLNEDLNTLEGYLFPETYKVTKFESPKSIITQMVNRFLIVWKEVEPEAKIKVSGWSRRQIITFASIVEKETGAGFERPLVASVFHNRLDKKMRLQTDPTVLYGNAVLRGKMPLNITKTDLLTPTLYNTYTNYGLPPTPICNPGKAAIMATINPAVTSYLFFVSQNNGTHVFSETIQQHNRAVQMYQMNAKARANKSWRDLKPANK
jgi:UPF0755 protein